MKVSLHPAQAVDKPSGGESRSCTTVQCIIEPLALGPFRKVRVPSGIEGVGLSSDLAMASYGRITRINQPLPGRLVWLMLDAGWRRKGPRASADCMKVPSFHPTGILSGMSTTTPTPQFAPDFEVQTVERAAGHTVTMIIRPPTYDGIELSDQTALCRRLVLLDHSPDLCQQRLGILFGRRY